MDGRSRPLPKLAEDGHRARPPSSPSAPSPPSAPAIADHLLEFGSEAAHEPRARSPHRRAPLGIGQDDLTLGLQRALARRGVRGARREMRPGLYRPRLPRGRDRRAELQPRQLRHDARPSSTPSRPSAAGEADLVIAEGSMGLFDGIVAARRAARAPAPTSRPASAGRCCSCSTSPDRRNRPPPSRSAAPATIRASRIAGVVLNKVASERHRRLVEDGMARIGLPVLGALMRDTDLSLARTPSRPRPGRRDRGARRAARAPRRRRGRRGRSRPALALAAADAARSGRVPCPCRRRVSASRSPPIGLLLRLSACARRLARGRRGDRAFSPLADEPPPADCDACWLPGGYPELHAGRLAAAQRFLGGLGSFAEAKPVHGECGGYMVLGRTPARTQRRRACHGGPPAGGDQLPQAQAASRLPGRPPRRGRRIGRTADNAWSAMNSTMPRSSTATRRREARLRDDCGRGRQRPGRYRPSQGARHRQFLPRHRAWVIAPGLSHC